MSIRANRRLILLLFGVGLLLSGCFQQPPPSENMYKTLEKVASAEKTFEDQQAPLVAAEQKEEKIYNQIIGLGMKQYDQIVKLSDEALALTDKRSTLMEKETQSLKESEQQFNKVKELKGDLEQTALKKQANELYTIMKKRYKAHDELYQHYKNALTYDQQLYKMLKDKSVSLDGLEAQINKLNETYEKIVKENNEFNELTKQYNTIKLQFYQTAGIKTAKTA